MVLHTHASESNSCLCHLSRPCGVHWSSRVIHRVIRTMFETSSGLEQQGSAYLWKMHTLSISSTRNLYERLEITRQASSCTVGVAKRSLMLWLASTVTPRMIRFLLCGRTCFAGSFRHIAHLNSKERSKGVTIDARLMFSGISHDRNVMQVISCIVTLAGNGGTLNGTS